MPIIRSGYAPQRRGRFTRAYQRARAQVLANALVCELCGQPPTANDPLEADHIIPWSAGGTHDPSNLRPAHRSCNLRRGAGA